MVLLFLLLAAAAPVTNPRSIAAPPMSEPALSPDHSEIAFVSGGDIWTVPAAGGEARLLVSHPATESRPRYSPDGTRLAFVSTRTGNGDIYVLHFRTGELKRITFDDALDALDAWSPDGKNLYYTSSRGDIGGMNDIYTVPADGGTPVAVTADRYADESQAAPNPLNGTLAFTSSAMAVNQWWRKGHAHIDETRFTIVKPAVAKGQSPQYQPVLQNHAKNLWPMWSADGARLFFVSDQSGSQNIWEIEPATAAHSAARQITKFNAGRVLWPGISKDGKAIVFERDFGIWKLDPVSGRAAPVEIALLGVPSGPSTTHLALTTGLRELALSPDGKKIAFVVRGNVFAASSKDGGAAVRITSTNLSTNYDAHEVAWAPDNRRLVYASDRDGVQHLFLYDLAKETETALTKDALKDDKPAWSPDGQQIAFIRDGRQLCVLDVEVKTERVLTAKKFRMFSSFSAKPLSWSPDGKWLAFFTGDVRGFHNVAVIPAAGGPEKTISYLGNTFSDEILWSPDRTYLLFNTAQRTEMQAIARIDLIPRTPKFREDQFRDLFKDETPRTAPPAPASPPAAPATTPATTPAALVAPAPRRNDKPVQITFEGIRRRLTLLPLGLDAGSKSISPDGKTLLFIATAGGQQNLYTYSLDELAKEPAVPRQLTSTAGRKSHAQFSPDGKEVFYLESGRVNAIPIDTRIAKPLALTAELDVDFAKEKREVFDQAWTTINETFYDPRFHGADWAAMRGRYAPIIEASRTPDEVRRAISLMIGELNSSHSGISGGLSAVAPPVVGRLGLTVDPSGNEITSVTPLGPADIAGVKTGEKLLAIDGQPLTPGTNLDELLQYKIGRRTVLKVGDRAVPVLPVNAATETHLLYEQWVEGRREYVHKVGNGRLGYVHIPDMSSGSLDQLYVDLDTENRSREGVVVDIRNNRGGFVNAYALDVFSRRPYLTMTPRDMPASSARSVLGQRALELPTVLVVNQNSLSDAEDFTEGYRALKLGKVVGVPTAGWIIYTGGTELIDGSVLRMPQVKITANDGTDMELHPRRVDVEVERPVGESYTGRDAQLDAAVKTLLDQLKAM